MQFNIVDVEQDENATVSFHIDETGSNRGFVSVRLVRGDSTKQALVAICGISKVAHVVDWAGQARIAAIPFSETPKVVDCTNNDILIGTSISFPLPLSSG